MITNEFIRSPQKKREENVKASSLSLLVEKLAELGLIMEESGLPREREGGGPKRELIESAEHKSQSGKTTHYWSICTSFGVKSIQPRRQRDKSAFV